MDRNLISGGDPGTMLVAAVGVGGLHMHADANRLVVGLATAQHDVVQGVHNLFQRTTRGQVDADQGRVDVRGVDLAIQDWLNDERSSVLGQHLLEAGDDAFNVKRVENHG